MSFKFQSDITNLNIEYILKHITIDIRLSINDVIINIKKVLIYKDKDGSLKIKFPTCSVLFGIEIFQPFIFENQEINEYIINICNDFFNENQFISGLLDKGFDDISPEGY